MAWPNMKTSSRGESEKSVGYTVGSESLNSMIFVVGGGGDRVGK